jgi:hypothetical protein
MVSCAGSSVPVSEAIVDAGAGGALAVGTAMARGNPAGAGAIGVSDGLGDGALAALAGVSDSDSPSRLGEAFAFALAFLIAVAPFFPTDFFFDFGLGLALGDFVDFAEVTSGVSLGFGLGFGVSSSSDGLCFFDLGLAVGVGEGLFCALDLCLVAFGFGLGDSLSEGDESLRASCCVFKNSSRLRFSSSLTCARSSVARTALSATTVPNHRRKRTTAAERNRGDRGFKLPAGSMPAVWP